MTSMSETLQTNLEQASPADFRINSRQAIGLRRISKARARDVVDRMRVRPVSHEECLVAVQHLFLVMLAQRYGLANFEDLPREEFRPAARFLRDVNYPVGVSLLDALRQAREALH